MSCVAHCNSFPGLREAKDADAMTGTVFLLKDSWTMRKLCNRFDLVALFMESSMPNGPRVGLGSGGSRGGPWGSGSV